MSRGPSTVARTCVGLGLLVATACGVPTDDGAKSVEVPNDVFPAGFDVSDQPDSNLPNVTFHPVYFLRNGFLVQRDRPLPPPVLIKKPLLERRVRDKYNSVQNQDIMRKPQKDNGTNQG